MNIIEDKIGGSAREDGTGRYVTRLYQVVGMGAIGSRFLPEVLSLRGIPQVGATHPYDASIRVTSRTVEIGRDRNDTVVRCEYGPPTNQGSDAEVGSVTKNSRSDQIQEVTTTDIDGRTMRTRYVSALSIGIGGSSVTITDLVHEVAVQRPTFSLVWNRIESTWPYPLMLNYSGFVNDGDFMGQPRDSWLMTIRSSEQREGRHMVEYTATFNADGWQAVIVHNENGRIPLDVSPANGIEIYQVYKRADFRRLGLPS